MANQLRVEANENAMRVENENDDGVDEMVYEQPPAERSVCVDPDLRSNVPLLWFFQWCFSWIGPGMGMFVEGYVSFSIFNNHALLRAAYPACWKRRSPTCSRGLINRMIYWQNGGLMAGMVLIGLFADRTGRKWGGVLTSVVMLVGGVLLAAADGPTDYRTFYMYSIAQAVFGIGGGGEYPVAAASACERAECIPALRGHRGQTVLLTFSMQTWGKVASVAALIIMLLVFGQIGNTLASDKANIVWRVALAVGVIPVVGVVLYRLCWMRESSVWRANPTVVQNSTVGKSFTMLKMVYFVFHYWHRVLACAACWFAWEFAFHANRVHQMTFYGISQPGARGNLYKTLQWQLINSAVALVGTWCAAFTVDRRWMGRRGMQTIGFLWLFALFLVAAIMYDSILDFYQPTIWFRLIFFSSTFWGHFGPNATTWLLAAETLPTEMRAFGHGIAAAAGKAGVIVAGVWLGEHASDRRILYICAFAGLAGAIVTIIFILDLTGLDMRHNDAHWLAICEHRVQQYRGKYRHPKHVSVWEHLIGVASRYRSNSWRQTMPNAPVGDPMPAAVPPEPVEPCTRICCLEIGKCIVENVIANLIGCVMGRA